VNRKSPFAPGESYHIYNRGAHKATVFRSPEDYERFLLLLYLANDPRPIEFRALAAKYGDRAFSDMYTGEDRQKDQVDILAHALMPNHFHLVLREKADGGIERFMRKTMTAYAMYFNAKHKHSGVLFQGRFKSSHIGNEDYFRWIFAYVHLNPIEVVAPDWEFGRFGSVGEIRKRMNEYMYSSYPDYQGLQRPHNRILAVDVPDFLSTQDDLADMLASIAKDRPLYLESVV
jgi:putative transposase